MGASLTTTSRGHVVMDLRKMAMRAKNPTAAWHNVGSYIAAVERRQFATSGAYLNGTPWKPLKPQYLQWKVRQGYSKRVLMQSGSLRLSFTSRPMAIEVYSGTSATFGSNHPVAKYHQHGTHSHKTGKRLLPKRIIMKTTPKMRRDVKTILAAHVLGKHTSVMALV